MGCTLGPEDAFAMGESALLASKFRNLRNRIQT